MKQLTLLFLMLTSFSLIAQEGTTLEEYRYLSKGYVYQLEMGLDAQKDGYGVKDLFETSTGAKLVGLYQNGSSEPRALLVILDHGKETVKYLCIPNGSADERVNELVQADQKNISSANKLVYQTALNEFLFEALSNPQLQVYSYTPPRTPVSPMVTPVKDETLVSRSAMVDNYIDKSPETTPKIEPEKPNKKVKASSRKISGGLEGRTVLEASEAVANVRKKGNVAIKICVDAAGNVTAAKFTQRGSTTFDSYLKKIALNAAKTIKFAKLDQNDQCGIVNYKF